MGIPGLFLTMLSNFERALIGTLLRYLAELETVAAMYFGLAVVPPVGNFLSWLISLATKDGMELCAIFTLVSFAKCKREQYCFLVIN